MPIEPGPSRSSLAPESERGKNDDDALVADHQSLGQTVGHFDQIINQPLTNP